MSPPFTVEPQHQKYACQQPSVKNERTEGMSLFEKEITETNPENCVHQHPHECSGQTPDYFFEKQGNIRFHDPNGLIYACKQASTRLVHQGISNFLNSDESPRKTLKSTRERIPLTLPASLNCHRLQCRPIRG